MQPPAATKKTSMTKPQLIVGVAGFILLLLSVAWGSYSGASRARSLDTFRSVSTLKQALNYYMKDQNQYPTADQFSNQQILTLNYLSSMPVPTDASGACASQTKFDYSRPTPQTFSLQFCLTQGVSGLTQGMHIMTNNNLQ